MGSPTIAWNLDVPWHVPSGLLDGRFPMGSCGHCHLPFLATWYAFLILRVWQFGGPTPPGLLCLLMLHDRGWSVPAVFLQHPVSSLPLPPPVATTLEFCASPSKVRTSCSCSWGIELKSSPLHMPPDIACFPGVAHSCGFHHPARM